MWLTQKARNVVRGLKQVWASPDAKGALWDKEYAGGRWDSCDHTPNALIYDFVYRYCHNGSVLELGCGTGNTGNEMDTNRYGDYTGIDISNVAVAKATARSAANGRVQNRYLRHDIIDYVPSRKHDVILFRESIYYIPTVKIKSVLDRYSVHLTEGGTFVVQAVTGIKPKVAKKILGMIERNFTIVEKTSPNRSFDFVVVFRK